MKRVWKIVSEKFSPFNVNVTTMPTSTPETHAVITNDYSGGGVAYLGTFPTPNAKAWINGTMADYSIGIVTAHELGHTFGLLHQSQWDASGKLVNAYRPGDALKGPIMGGAGNARALWAYGTSEAGPQNFQDDLAVIAAKIAKTTGGTGYRADDHGNTAAAANPLSISGSNVSGSGVIETIGDADFFSFTTTTGNIDLTVSPAADGPMLDAKVVLTNSAGTILKTVDTASLGESLIATVAPALPHRGGKPWRVWGRRSVHDQRQCQRRSHAPKRQRFRNARAE